MLSRSVLVSSPPLYSYLSTAVFPVPLFNVTLLPVSTGMHMYTHTHTAEMKLNNFLRVIFFTSLKIQLIGE